MSARLSILTGILLASASLTAMGEPLFFSRIAGTPPGGTADGPLLNARFWNPGGVAADAAGTIYVADSDNHTIRKISGGMVTTIAGQAGVSGSADGVGAEARFYQPQGLAVGPDGTLYVADTGNNVIRTIAPDGTVKVFAGTPGLTGGQNGAGTNALFNAPEAIAINNFNNMLYVADTGNHTIRQITMDGMVSTLAGSTGVIGSADGMGSAAKFYEPRGIAVGLNGALYVADSANETIRMVTTNGMVSTLAGLVGVIGSQNGTGDSARFYEPGGIGVGTNGLIYVADSFNHTIRVVTTNGIVGTIAGLAGHFGNTDGTGNGASFHRPRGLTIAGDKIVVADSANGIIRQLNFAGMTSKLAGAGSMGVSDGVGETARFSGPAGIAVSGDGAMYVSDTLNQTIRRVSTNGEVTTLAGLAGVPGTNDGVGTAARFSSPQGVAVNSSGILYMADAGNHTIRRILADGTVSTIAGLAGVNGSYNGVGTNALFNGPEAVAVDAANNVFVADTGNHLIRKISADGTVTTLAGVPEFPGSLDSDMPGAGTNTARFHSPGGVAVGPDGSVYVCDTGNHEIRKVTVSGVVSTLAGLVGVYGSADGTNSEARFYQPRGIVVGASGELFVMDSGNHAMRRVAPSGTNWVVTTVAGVPGSTGAGDGMGARTGFRFPGSMGVNAAGLFAIADTGNNSVLVGLSGSDAVPRIESQPADKTVTEGEAVNFTVLARGLPPIAYQWRFNGTNLPGSASPTLNIPVARLADAGLYSVVASNAAGSQTSSNALLTVIRTLVPSHIDTVKLLPDGSLRLEMTATPFTLQILQISTNLLTWEPVATLQSTNGLLQYIDPSAATRQARFYRLLLGE